jgi:branched-chain amino acid transport system substrate-binding protein
MERTIHLGTTARLRRLGAIALAGTVALAFAGCASATPSSSSSASTTLQVGLAVPLTGAISAAGIPQQQGAELAVKEINDSHYIPGVQIQLSEVDTKADQAEAIAATQKLISGGAVAVLGGTTTGEAGVIKPRTTKAKVPFMILSSLDPTMAESPVSFREVPLASSTGGANAQAAKALAAEGVKTAVVAHTTDNDGQAADAASWTKELQANGVKVVLQTGANSADTNLSGPAAQVVSAKPDLLIVSMLPGQDANFVKAVRDLGFTGKVASYQSLSTAAAYALAGSDLDGTVVAALFQPQADFAETKTFVKNFTAAYNKAPNIQNAIGYAATWLLADGMKGASKPSDPASIDTALSKIKKRDTVFGPVTFDNGQAFVHGDLPLAVWKPGGQLAPWR